VNPEPFLQLDRVIHEKGRLAIMSLLAASPQLSFTEMRDTLNMTDGNITAHVRTLHESGYIAVTKAFQGAAANSPPTRSLPKAAKPSPPTSTCWSKSSGRPRRSSLRGQESRAISGGVGAVAAGNLPKV